MSPGEGAGPATDGDWRRGDARLPAGQAGPRRPSNRVCNSHRRGRGRPHSNAFVSAKRALDSHPQHPDARPRRLLRTVFSFGAALDEYLERDLRIVLAALLQGRPRSLGVKVRLERDQADAQGREVAVEVVVFGGWWSRRVGGRRCVRLHVCSRLCFAAGRLGSFVWQIPWRRGRRSGGHSSTGSGRDRESICRRGPGRGEGCRGWPGAND